MASAFLAVSVFGIHLDRLSGIRESPSPFQRIDGLQGRELGRAADVEEAERELVIGTGRQADFGDGFVEDLGEGRVVLDAGDEVQCEAVLGEEGAVGDEEGVMALRAGADAPVGAVAAAR
jgi:hypothetical protein